MPKIVKDTKNNKQIKTKNEKNGTWKACD